MRLFKKKEPIKLKDKTPQWFEDWHNTHFEFLRQRTVRNERFIYLILAAIISGSIFGRDAAQAMAKAAIQFISG